MALRTVGPRLTAEAVEDVVTWVTQLSGCPKVTRTKVAVCTHPAHEGEASIWFFVEGDPQAGVARLRCVAGGHINELLDSAENWTYPKAWQCPACSQSIAEVVFGVHELGGIADWLVVAVRCVECGEVAGITDMVVKNLPVDELLDQL